MTARHERSRRLDLIFRIQNEDAGGVALIAAFMLPVFLILTGSAIDLAVVTRHKEHLQAAADAAATAAAKELTLIDYTKQDANGMASAMVVSTLSANTSSLLKAGAPGVTATTDTSPLRVTVDATQTVQGVFGSFGFGATPISVRAVAQVIGRPNICVLGLDPSSKGAIYLEKSARMTGQNCAAYSNSTHPNGIFAKNSAALIATMICSAGGKAGGPGNFSPEPLTDCPVFDDPLASRAAPASGACIATNLEIDNQAVTLQPGTYCGGIAISGSSTVTFASGIYVIKDGPLTVVDTASVAGEFVGFHFTGSKATFKFDTATTISLSAPKSGQMAGLLMFEARTQQSATHEILSDNARTLLGTIYLPRSELKIDANKPIADQSAYTAIVAKTITLYSGPNLVLNTNYDQTPVPVPEGIKGVGQPVALVQ